MAMKQTQTKMFDFSDVGLDFSSGSKALFPDRFKKMLVQGYNVQTVIGVTVIGNQYTFTYGGVHGYAAGRVLKIDSGLLATINGGECVIDSVTPTTLTLTIDDGPGSIIGNFTTRVSSLGWSLEYESGLVQLYKMKYLDGRDCYVRFVFTLSTTAYKNMVTVCVGQTADISTGVITDSLSHATTKENTNIVTGFVWAFTVATTPATIASYIYSQGLDLYGRGSVVGSKYHILILNNGGTEDYAGRVQGIIPQQTLDIDVLDFPLVLGTTVTSPTSTSTVYAEVTQFGDKDAAMIGNVSVALSGDISATSSIGTGIKAASSFYSGAILGQQITAAYPITLHEKVSKQFLGFAYGLYRVDYASSNKPSHLKANSPSLTTDFDINSTVVLHAAFTGRGDTYFQYFAAPVEEIKIA